MEKYQSCKLSNILQGVTRDVTVDSTDVKKRSKRWVVGIFFLGLMISGMGNSGPGANKGKL